MSDIRKVFDPTQAARADIEEMVETLLSIVSMPLIETAKGNAVAKIEGALELVRLLDFAATKPFVFPHMEAIMRDIAKIAKSPKVAPVPRIRAVRLKLKIAELNKMPAKPRKVVIKIITEPPRESTALDA
jgi:hypothetical protein